MEKSYQHRATGGLTKREVELLKKEFRKFWRPAKRLNLSLSYVSLDSSIVRLPQIEKSVTNVIHAKFLTSAVHLTVLKVDGVMHVYTERKFVNM